MSRRKAVSEYEVLFDTIDYRKRVNNCFGIHDIAMLKWAMRDSNGKT